MRAVADTNVVISRFLSPTGPPADVLRRWRQERFELVASNDLLDEYQRALGYDKVRVRHRMSDQEISEVIEEFRRFAILVEPTETIDVIRDDPDDNRVLECAVAGSAEIVVSGDRHLHQLRTFRGIRILSPAAFLAYLDSQADSP